MSFLELRDLVHNFSFVNLVCELISNKLNIKNDSSCCTTATSFLFDLCQENPKLDFVNYENALRFIDFSLDEERISSLILF